MKPIEIAVIAACALIIGGVIAGSAVRRFRDKKKGVPPGCSGCEYYKRCQSRRPPDNCPSKGGSSENGTDKDRRPRG